MGGGRQTTVSKQKTCITVVTMESDSERNHFEFLHDFDFCPLSASSVSSKNSDPKWRDMDSTLEKVHFTLLLIVSRPVT